MAVIVQAPPTVPATIAQQIFVIGSGIAGGLAGWKLASELRNVENVSTPLVVGTTVVSVLFTIAAGVYLVRKAKESYV